MIHGKQVKQDEGNHRNSGSEPQMLSGAALKNGS